MLLRALKTFDSGDVGHIRHGQAFHVGDRIGFEMLSRGLAEPADSITPTPAENRVVAPAATREFIFGGAPEPGASNIVAPPCPVDTGDIDMSESRMPKPRRRL